MDIPSPFTDLQCWFSGHHNASEGGKDKEFSPKQESEGENPIKLPGQKKAAKCPEARRKGIAHMDWARRDPCHLSGCLI
jgi:hypothetical protein